MNEQWSTVDAGGDKCPVPSAATLKVKVALVLRGHIRSQNRGDDELNSRL